MWLFSCFGISDSWYKMCTSNYHFEWKFGVLLFCDAKICSTISGKLLRFLGNSFFIPFKFPECMIISKFYRFIYKFRENRLQFICWMNLIYIIQSVFLQKNAIWVVLISSLEPQITCLLSFIGTVLQNTASLTGSALNNQEIWESNFGTL